MVNHVEVALLVGVAFLLGVVITWLHFLYCERTSELHAYVFERRVEDGLQQKSVSRYCFYPLDELLGSTDLKDHERPLFPFLKGII